MSTGLPRLFAGMFLVLWASIAGARPITLGLIAPPAEPDATSLLRGVQLAVADANEAGDGPVELAVRSEGGQWGSVGNDAVVLVSSRHVDGIITPSDGAASHLILQVAGRTRVPVVSLSADSSVTAAGVPWCVRVVPRTDQEAEALFAATQHRNLPPLRWWAIVPAGRPGRVVRRDLATAARSTSTRLERIEDGSEAKADLDSLVQRIMAAAPGGVLLWVAPSSAGTLAAALRTAGYRGALAGPSSLDAPPFFAAAGDAATGVFVTEYRPDSESQGRAEKFEIRYERKYKTKPDVGVAAAYDAACVLIQTVRRAGESAVDRQFPLALPTSGVTGILHFDQAGNRTDALQVLTGHEGQFLPLLPTKT